MYQKKNWIHVNFVGFDIWLRVKTGRKWPNFTMWDILQIRLSIFSYKGPLRVTWKFIHFWTIAPVEMHPLGNPSSSWNGLWLRWLKHISAWAIWNSKNFRIIFLDTTKRYCFIMSRSKRNVFGFCFDKIVCSRNTVRDNGRLLNANYSWYCAEKSEAVAKIDDLCGVLIEFQSHLFQIIYFIYKFAICISAICEIFFMWFLLFILFFWKVFMFMHLWSIYIYILFVHPSINDLFSQICISI